MNLSLKFVLTIVAVVVVLVACYFLFGGKAYAADTHVYNSKAGKVSFNHVLHAERHDCKLCHDHMNVPADKFKVDKKFAHVVCKGCHEVVNGPQKCHDCHIK